MKLSMSVRIALSILPMMNGDRVRMEQIVGWIAQFRLPHRKSIATLRLLVRAGILKGHRGAGGGYTLAMAAKDITVAKIIEAVEGPIFPAEGPQAVRRVAKAFREQTDQEARRMTLADLT
jgi:DNA-binding IscR family transcriptional regulator